MRMLAAALAATLFATPALAEFKATKHVDSFDGKVTKMILQDASPSHGMLGIFAQTSDQISTMDHLVLWQPRDSHICATADFLFVEWLYVDAAGTIDTTKHDKLFMDVQSNRQILQTKTDMQNWASVRAFFDALKKPGAVRLRYQDSCGTRVTEEFPTDGFEKALQETNS